MIELLRKLLEHVPGEGPDVETMRNKLLGAAALGPEAVLTVIEDFAREMQAEGRSLKARIEKEVR